MANYHKEREAFSALWQVECKKPIVFYRGKAGSGKTTLLRSCYDNVPDNIHKLLIDLKLTSINITDIFSRIGHRLGWHKLSHLQSELTGRSPAIHAHINSNDIQGNNNLLHIALNTGTSEERERKQILLMDAWIKDLQALDKAFLIVFDTYNPKTPTEVKNWIESLLVRFQYAENLRLAIGGQETPDLETGEEWTSFCKPFELNGVIEAEHWLPVVKSLGRRFPDKVEPLSYMACLCDIFQGHPKPIIEYIQARFPKNQ